MTHSKQIAETADYVLDDIITELGCEPDGHKTWAKTTDEIVETIKPILTQALQTAERRGEEREREKLLRKMAGLYERFENAKPPLEFHRQDAQWNAGLYRGGLKGMESVCVEVFDTNGDALSSLKPTSEQTKSSGTTGGKGGTGAHVTGCVGCELGYREHYHPQLNSEEEVPMGEDL